MFEGLTRLESVLWKEKILWKNGVTFINESFKGWKPKKDFIYDFGNWYDITNEV
jgi:hypothetical protein